MALVALLCFQVLCDNLLWEKMKSLMQFKTAPRCPRSFLAAFSCLLLALSLAFVSGCFSHRLPRFGIGGRYQEGKQVLTIQRGSNVDRAIVALESVVRENPLYENSLTLLGWAYYRKGRYQDALQILQRALAISKKDEIAWLVLGLAQLRLGADQDGMNSVKGGITLLGRVSTNGYRGHEEWDRAGLVKSAIRRSVRAIRTRGLEDKKRVIRAVEIALQRVAEEEWDLDNEELQNRIREF